MRYLNKYQDEFDVLDAMEKDFIDEELIHSLLDANKNPGRDEVRRVLEKSRNCIRLDLDEMAILIGNNDPDTIQEMFGVAFELKKEVYGDRIVFFAPLYISDECANNCKYCGFRSSNVAIHRKTLNMQEIEEEVQIMIDEGQKRTVLVYGESPKTNVDFMCESVRKVYEVKTENGEIRRANINCAPLAIDELKN